MARLGQYNTLTVLKSVDFGLYLDGGDGLEILMPQKYVPKGTQVGDSLRVFVYQDAAARLLATTEHPATTVGQCAYLRIEMVTSVGAFADWGVSKQLLIPLSEQTVKMQEGHRYMIYIYIDTVSGRIVGSAKIDRHLGNTPPSYHTGDEVEIMIWKRTPLGYKAIINHQHIGMLYENQIFQDLTSGQSLHAFIRTVRDDDKIDLSLQPVGYTEAEPAAEESLLKALRLHAGFLPLTDHSSPQLIASQLQLSKKAFKRAVGALYKQRLITLEDDGIRLLSEE